MRLTYRARRVTLFAGHYGSGKTNLAINFALALKKEYERVSIADLDIVNPYYRTKDAAKMLAEAGIHLIASDYADTNVDVPAMPAEAYAVTDDKSRHAVIDVGGDDRGALALGRYTDKLKQENDYDMYLVVNRFRPLTRDAAGALKVMREIEQAADMKFTAVINNSNLGGETTAADIITGDAYAREIAAAAGLEVRFTGVLETLYEEVRGTIKNAVPIKLYVKQSWLK